MDHPLSIPTEPYPRPQSSLRADILALTDSRNESAVDITTEEAPPYPYARSSSLLDVSVPTGKEATSERIRRRSDVSRFRAPDSPVTNAVRLGGTTDLDDVELPVLSYITEEQQTPACDEQRFDADAEKEFVESSGASTAARWRSGDVEHLGGANGAEEIELANLGSGQQEPIVSVSVVFTEAERRVFRMKSRVHFGALCWSLFLEGWNDGSTGPLLPAIQKHYGVRL